MTTSLEKLYSLAARGNYDLVPVSAELYADDVTPIMVLRKLQNVSLAACWSSTPPTPAPKFAQF